MGSQTVITLDMEWASDCVMEEVARLLLERRVKSTWFVTHAAPVLDLLRRNADLFELGIHPNFREGSSHGRTMPEVIEHCLGLVPEAVSARSHGLMQSDYLWRHYIQATPIRYECSTFLGPVPRAYPTRFSWAGGSLVRVPFVYQDNLEMSEPKPTWDAETFLAGKTGLQVLSFHPFFVATNSTSMAAFDRVKQTAGHMQAVTEKEVLSCRQAGPGARTMFVGLIEYLAARGGGSWVKEVAPFDPDREPPR